LPGTRRKITILNRLTKAVFSCIINITVKEMIIMYIISKLKNSTDYGVFNTVTEELVDRFTKKEHAQVVCEFFRNEDCNYCIDKSICERDIFKNIFTI